MNKKEKKIIIWGKDEKYRWIVEKTKENERKKRKLKERKISKIKMYKRMEKVAEQNSFNEWISKKKRQWLRRKSWII